MKHVVQVATAFASSVKLAFGDGFMGVVLLIRHL